MSSISKNEDFIGGFSYSPEETEFAKIKQDYILEYDELTAYETSIQLGEKIVFDDKDLILRLLNEGKKEEESMAYWFQLHAPIILDNLWSKMINNALKRSQAFLMDHRNSEMALLLCMPIW